MIRERLHQLQERIAHDPKLKQAIDTLRPKRTLWGLLGVVLFFFLPELITYIWQPELIAWTHHHAITEPLAMPRMLYGELETMFADGVSWLNIGMGVLLLVWMWKRPNK